MDASKPESAKQLKEYLQHQQEPFSLQTYLSERSYMFKNSTSVNNTTTRNIHCLHSQKNLKRSVKCDSYNVRRTLLQAKGILRSILLCKFILSGDSHEFSNWGHKSDQKKPQNGFYLKKRLAASDDFIYHDVEDNFLSYEHHGSALMSMFQTFTLPEFRRVQDSVGDPMFSTYLRKQFVNLGIGKMGHVRNNKPQMVRTTICQRKKRILQRKAEQCHEKEGKKVPVKEVSECEELENIIHKHFFLMEKQYAEAKEITHLLQTEYFFTSEEWRNYSNTQIWEIQMEIGDAIMDDIVREIIVSFLLSMYQCS